MNYIKISGIAFFLLISLIFSSCIRIKEDLINLRKIDNTLNIDDWDLKNKNNLGDLTEYVLCKSNQDTNIYLHYTKINSLMGKDTLIYGDIYTKMCYYDSLNYNELVISKQDTLYHLLCPGNMVIKNEEYLFRRDTLNLMFKKGKEYYLDRYFIRAASKKLNKGRKPEDTVDWDEKRIEDTN